MKQQVGIVTHKFIAGLIIAVLAFCAVSGVCPLASAATGWSKTYGGANDEALAYPLLFRPATEDF